MGEIADILLEEHSLFFYDEFEDCAELIWETKGGDNIPVSKMKDSHLQNCINMLKRRKQDADFWIACFEDELEKRNKFIKKD